MRSHNASMQQRENFPVGYLDSLFCLDDNLGYEIYHRILMDKGAHITLIGNSRSGKSNKKKWLQLPLSWIGETIIEIDTGKTGDTECYFDNPDPARRFNKPVNILIPYEGGCRFVVTGVPEGIPVTVIPVLAPELYWEAIRPGEINIISLRNYFLDINNLKIYMRKMFKNFALRARLGEFDRWVPATLSIDEAHEAVGSQSVSRDSVSIQLTSDLANMERQLAASGIRMMLTTQGFKDLPEAIRQNTHIFVVGRGASAEKSESPGIHYLEGFARKAAVNEGWFVIHGEHYYKRSKIPFPHIKTPSNIRISYSGFVDAPDADVEEVGELLVNGGWMAAAHIPREMESTRFSRGDIPDMEMMI